MCRAGREKLRRSHGAVVKPRFRGRNDSHTTVVHIERVTLGGLCGQRECDTGSTAPAHSEIGPLQGTEGRLQTVGHFGSGTLGANGSLTINGERSRSGADLRRPRNQRRLIRSSRYGPERYDQRQSVLHDRPNSGRTTFRMRTPAKPTMPATLTISVLVRFVFCCFWLLFSLFCLFFASLSC